MELKNLWSKKFPGTGITGKDNPASKRYWISTPTGEIIFTECLADFCRDRKLNYGSFLNHSRGNKKHHMNYIIIKKEIKEGRV